MTEVSPALDAVRIGYRPDEPGFRRRETGEVVTRAAVVWFEPDGSAWALTLTPSPERSALSLRKVPPMESHDVVSF
jgi:hypothetical protein